MVEFFPDAKELEAPQLLFMMCVYGYILYSASKTLSEGAEMLLLKWGPGIIGGILIPLLGAVPDSVIILVSGMGSGTREEIQQQLLVGVGTLCGSTVMLITIPWAIAVFLGRRDLDHRSNTAAITSTGKPKLTHFSMATNVVTVFKEIIHSARVMIFTAAAYLLIQIPAFFYHNQKDGGAKKEAPFALFGLVACLSMFGVYCWMQLRGAEEAELQRLKQVAEKKEQWKRNLDLRYASEFYQREIFQRHDKDRSGFLDRQELSQALQELGLKLERRDLNALLEMIDQGHVCHEADKQSRVVGRGDHKISFPEFQAAINMWLQGALRERQQHEHQHGHQHQHDSTTACVVDVDHCDNSDDEETALLNTEIQTFRKQVAKLSKDKYGALQENKEQQQYQQQHEEEEQEEEDEEEEQFLHLSDKQLLFQAGWLLLVGTALVLIFSDPMVECINQIGQKLEVSPFYISFLVTPLASNASEIIAGLIFAAKKTDESISLAHSSLYGAATMNNTFVLSIFMALIYFRGLSWSFTSQTLTTLFVIVVVGWKGQKRTLTLWDALFVSLLFPFSILSVFCLEKVFGY